MLTAAHCVTKFNPSQLLIATGLNNIKEDLTLENTYSVSGFIYHPKWDKNKMINDIAVLKLSRPVKLSTNVSIICLPSASDAPNVLNKQVTTVGWYKLR